MATQIGSGARVALSLVLLAVSISCVRPPGGEQQGQARLPLQATSARGNVYQLRNATFRLTGPTSVTLTTSGLPDPSPALTATLQTGSYSAELLAGWMLVRLDAAGGTAQAVQAQLVSANPTTFTVVSQQNTTVGFIFNVLGDVVDMSQGSASIVIVVNEPDAGTDAGTDAPPICRPINQTCGRADDCCSRICMQGHCTDGVCSPITGQCGRSGGTCCTGSFCTQSTQSGDTCVACLDLTRTCSANEQCCSNSCVAGRCTDGSCSQVNGPCGRSGGTCCTGSFCTQGTQSGDTCAACLDLTRTCSANEQCCSNSCVAGRCTDGSCSQVNGPCGRSGGTCCAGSFCTQGTQSGDTCAACLDLTRTCSSNGQCCSNSCVAGRCTDGSCSQVDGPCGRSGGTCCAGSFCALNGSIIGDTCLVCRQPQQTCSGSEQCCNGSCVAGRCAAPTTLAVPTFVGAGAGAAGTLSLAVPYPTGLSANDLLILQVGCRTAGCTPGTPPAGFISFEPSELANPGAFQRLYYRFATGSETGTLAVTLALTADSGAGRLYAFRGVTSTAAGFTEGATTSAATIGTLPGPSIVTTGPGRLAVAFVSLDSNKAMEPFVGSSGGVWTEPVSEFLSDVGNNFGLQLQVAPLPVAGTLSGGTANFGGSTDSSVCRAGALIGI